MRLFEFYAEPKECSYLSDKTSRFRYFHIQNCSDSFYIGLLERGWRRFGNYFFVPICNECQKCITIRTLVEEFKFSKNHRRVIKNNYNTELYIQKPTISQEHLNLYDKYHKKMHTKKGWEYIPITQKSYTEMFVEGHQHYGYEFLYIIDSKLIGVGLVDILQDSISAVYFFYDHDYENLSLGTFNILMQLRIAKEKKLKYFYPGYWIEGHSSMGYKERFKPFECLVNMPDIFDNTQWALHTKDFNTQQVKANFTNTQQKDTLNQSISNENTKQMQGFLPMEIDNNDIKDNPQENTTDE